ncbi:lactonase family protein [Zhihengliuella flava]|uniref:6-phosphogluconolactonase n=1 Tax=Zhihengliuella flava TaxID=1285193 RepID=A0A931D2Q6_9MICC|nr:beta-propeller fold lactonase family protein [Zhihengliuella flava]MBG6083294.1 6-phosphogluconolactonase [Zhihengliuella flava]
MPQPTTVDLYIACAGADRIDRLRLDTATGGLEATGQSWPAPGIRTSAYDGDRSLYYAGQSTSPGSIQVLQRDDAGALTTVATAEVPDKCVNVSLAPHGSAIFSASYHGHSVFGLPLDADGIPNPPAVAGDAPGEKAHSVVVAPDGQHAYVASLGDDVVVAYAVEGARLVEVSRHRSPEGAGPRHLRFSSGGDVLYVLHEMTGLVLVYRRDLASGALRQMQAIDSVPESLELKPGWARDAQSPWPGLDRVWCADLHLTGEGRFLYTTERSTSTINGFAVDDQGTLSLLGTWETEKQPRGAAIVAGVDAEYFLVAGEASDSVTAHQLDRTTGELSVTGRAPTGAGPLWIEPATR